MKKISVPTALLLILVSVGLISAVIYWTGTQTLHQTIKEVATGTITAHTITLPNINEASENTYDNTTTGFDKALTVNTSTDARTLYVDFTNYESVGNSYDNYKLELIADTAPSTSGVTPDTIVLKVDLSTTTATLDLGKAGEYKFDYKVSENAKSVSGDTVIDADFQFRVE